MILNYILLFIPLHIHHLYKRYTKSNCIKRTKSLDLLHLYACNNTTFKELHLREDELNRVCEQQRLHKEELHRRERELIGRELDLVEREIQVGVSLVCGNDGMNLSIF